MSSVLDSDAARTLADGRATVGSVLSSAQSHLKKVFLVFVAAMMGTIWALRAFVWDRLKADLVYSLMSESLREETEIIAVTPFDVILLQVKIGLLVGIFVSIPVLIYLSRDALKARGYWPSQKIPTWKVWGFVIAIILLFAGGSSYAYFLFFPIMFEFLAGNAVQVGFSPTWSIVMWTEFIFFLGVSFGLAAQLPLAMSSAARTGVIPYETFRDKWRYAVVAIFVFGAVFSPPDPFTQIMWGVPLVALYAVSLGVTKLAVLSKRAGESVPLLAVARTYWNLLAGVAVLSAAAIYLYFLEGGIEVLNEVLSGVGSNYRFASADQIDLLGLSPTAAVALVAALTALLAIGVSLFYLRIVELERVSRESDDDEDAQSEPGEPAEIDISAMSARAIEATGPQAFTELSEERALEYAEQELENDNPQKAKAIFDSYDEAQEYIAEQEAKAEDETADADDENVITSTAAGVIDPFTEDETTEDDIGGYYYDIAFILDSLTSRAIWIVATFMVVLAGSFMFLYTGGIQQITDVFVQNMPVGVQDQFEIVTLHPVEALIFMLKFSTALAFVSIVPLVFYFAWPAIEERGVGSGNRNVLLVWAGTMFVALVGGSLLGFLYIAPTIISLLANDVIASDMIIAYRISSFGWLVIYLTLGVGILSMIPTTMVLFFRGNLISYRRMRKSWRGVVLAFFAAAGLLSPSGTFTMFLVAVPASLAYVFGLGLLWFYRFVSPNRPRSTPEAAD